MRIAAAILALSLASGAHAQWSVPQDAEFTQNCLGSCIKEANETRCKSHCSCMLVEVKRLLPDYAAADEGAKRNDASIIKSVGEARQICARQPR